MSLSSTSTPIVSPAPPGTFHQFPELPGELQFMVWRSVPSIPRFFRVDEDGIHLLDGRRRARVPHILLRICYDSRKIALERMKDTGGFTHGRTLWMPVYFDMDYDILDISFLDKATKLSWTRISLDWDPPLAPSIEELTHSMSCLARNLTEREPKLNPLVRSQAERERKLTVKNISCGLFRVLPRSRANLSPQTKITIKKKMKRLFPAADSKILMSDVFLSLRGGPGTYLNHRLRKVFYIIAMSPECQEVAIRSATLNHQGVYELAL
ncbi:hypothetical protein QBC37DRAFT_403389 [Rhypophila decipiens]|uniref:2EXR domain-containing protein n=1 Tax=Rhypophila decipiens TaxID=261697 RepID=A0AAN6Y108_9PEZI|nr:hypothetical protein QBC37DRAFT_403389 [Rhypophila decipiens]